MSRDEKTNELITTRNVEFTCKKRTLKDLMNLEAIVRIKTCCSVSENFVRNFVFLCICCNFRLRILGFLVSAGHAFVKIRPILLSTFYKTRNETRWLMGNIYVSSKFTFISHYREHVKISQLSTCEKNKQNKTYIPQMTS